MLTYDDAKVLSYAFKLGMLTGDYVFIVVEGSADYLQTNLSEQDTSQVSIVDQWAVPTYQ